MNVVWPSTDNNKNTLGEDDLCVMEIPGVAEVLELTTVETSNSDEDLLE